MRRERAKPKTGNLTLQQVQTALNQHGSIERAALFGLNIHPVTLHEWLRNNGLHVQHHFEVVKAESAK